LLGTNFSDTQSNFIKKFNDNRKQYTSLGIAAIFIFLSLIYLGPLGGLEDLGLIGQKKGDQEAQAGEVVRGAAGDKWADIIIGKPEFSEIVPNTVVPNRLWGSRGVIIDRNSSPQRMYVWDGSNSRILGFNWENCLSKTTDPANCSADIVIGQPNMNSTACNGDSGFQNFPNRAPASAATLCGLNEDQLSISEAGSASNMYIDSASNLYVTDIHNNRVLKYIDPFATDKVADDAWGQNDFSGNDCNKGQSVIDASTLCFKSNQGRLAGVHVDSSGNLWVTDTVNNRVLRFPQGSKQANLVLGQDDFTSRGAGSALDELNHPAAVRVNDEGQVYVADKVNNRVLVYDPPFTNGMSGRNFGTGFKNPTSLEIDPFQSGIWVSNFGNSVVELWDMNTESKVREVGTRGNGNVLGNVIGSIGIDKDGNMLLTPGAGARRYDVLLFAQGQPAHTWTRRLFGSSVAGNQKDAFGLVNARGIAISNNQLIVGDAGRIMFWNNPGSLSNGQPADGYAGLGSTSFSQFISGCCSVMKADKNNNLWVSAAHTAGFAPTRVEHYNLPLSIGEEPDFWINYPIPVLGGGQIDGDRGTFYGVAVTENSEFLWISHPNTSRVFRVRNPLTNPVVDVVLGQTDINGTACNRGVDLDGDGKAGEEIDDAQLNTLCYPGHVALDNFGNLYVQDHSLEIRGNRRMLIFDNSTFPTNNSEVVLAQNPVKVFENVAAWEMAFDSQNRMVMGFNQYYPSNPGDPGAFFAAYNDPLGSGTSPEFLFNDFFSMGFSAAFDENDNLYAGDANRGRLLIYKAPFADSSQQSPSPSESPVASPSPSPSPSSSPIESIVDDESPNVVITSPPDGAVIEGKPGKVIINAQATDNIAVTRVQILIDGEIMISLDDATSVYYTWNIAPKKIASGAHLIEARAFDAAGNLGSTLVTVIKQ